MLIAAAAIWLTLLLLVVAFCRAAASADSNDVARSSRYPSRSTGPLQVGAAAGARAIAGRIPPRGGRGRGRRRRWEDARWGFDLLPVVGVRSQLGVR
jgi:hypothetical protein